MWDFIKDNWIALVALIISIIGFFKDNIKDIIKVCKNKKINNSAVISVSYINEKLIISNKGKSNAMNIHIYIDNEIYCKKYICVYSDFQLIITSGIVYNNVQ